MSESNLLNCQGVIRKIKQGRSIWNKGIKKRQKKTESGKPQKNMEEQWRWRRREGTWRCEEERVNLKIARGESPPERRMTAVKIQGRYRASKVGWSRGRSKRPIQKGTGQDGAITNCLNSSYFLTGKGRKG